MKFPPPRPRDGQTFVFFLVAFMTVFLLCGLGLDSGMYYLQLSRLSRATDSAVITGVQNFAKGRDEAARIMRNIAVANFPDLSKVSENAIESSSPNRLGGTDYSYAYLTPNGKWGITNTLATGSEGHITLARTAATAPFFSNFIWVTGAPAILDLDLATVSEAERRPRLITLVLDRSGSMLTDGAQALPAAVRLFLNSDFDEEADQISIVSYSAFARLEMAHTTNFITEGMTNQHKADGDDGSGTQSIDNPSGMKFGGVTAADEGMRLAVETMRTNEAFRNVQYDKYIIFMTDGDFNSVRSLYASPTYTNRIMMTNSLAAGEFSHYGTNFSPYLSRYKSGQSTTVNDYYYLLPNLTDNGEHSGNQQVATKDKAAVPSIFEPEILRDNVSSMEVTGSEDNGLVKGTVNVWLPPGSVAIHRNSVDGIPDSDTNTPDNDIMVRNYFSYYTNSAVNIPLRPGEYIDLVLPGYVVDAVSSGYMTLKQNGRHNNFDNNKSYWPDHPDGEDVVDSNNYFQLSDLSGNGNSDSLYRDWMMRNRANLLWDFVLFKPEDGRWDGFEPYTYPPPEAGFFYPGGMFFWSHNNYASQKGGDSYAGIHRLSTNLVMTEPRFAGNTFYTTTGVMDNESDWKVGAPNWLEPTFGSVMSVQRNPDPNQPAWTDYPVWRPRTYNGDLVDTTLSLTIANQVNLMTNTDPYDPVNNPLTPPLRVLGSGANSLTNTTAGWMYVFDPNTDERKLMMNSMSFNSRPTYFFDFKDGRWERIIDWDNDDLMTQTGDWKAKRYCDAIRDEDVTVFTVAFKKGNEGLLKQMANTPDSGSFDPSQPQGKYLPTDDQADLEEAFQKLADIIQATIKK
ncbi:MAG: VWA domain-containing protein [Verrucomicrobiota bacterium]